MPPVVDVAPLLDPSRHPPEARRRALALIDGAFRVELEEDGSMHGYFGGGVLVDEILAIAANDGVDDGLYDLMESLLGVAADLAPDENGECSQISVTLEFDAVSAYFFDD